MSKKILIIEDEKNLIDSLKEKLTNVGFEVLTAGDGIAGLDMAFQNEPDLILLDIVMPKMNGLEMLERLRKDEWGRRAPVVLLTNYGDADQMEEAKKYDVRDYIIKANVKLQDVVDKVKNILK